MTLYIIKKAGDEIKENCQLHEDILLQHHILRILNPQENSYVNISFMVIWPWDCLTIYLFVKIEHSRFECCLKSFAEFIFRDRKPSLMGNSPSGRKLVWYEFSEGQDSHLICLFYEKLLPVAKKIRANIIEASHSICKLAW